MQVSKKKGFAFYFLNGLLAVFLIVAGLVYVQLRDLDNLRGMVVQKLEDISGHSISIGAMELDFTKGIGIRLGDIVIGPPERPRQQFSARSAWVVVELWPLLSQEVEIRKFIAQGTSFKLIRDEQGRFNVGDFGSALTDSTEKSFVDGKVYIFNSNRQWLWARHIVIIEKLDFAILYRKLVNETDCKHFEQTIFSRVGQDTPKITHVEPALFIPNKLE